jgi:hypothetical protein
VSGSLRTTGRVAAAALLTAASAVLTGCDATRAEVWVRNQTDRTYALLLAATEGPKRLAFVEIPPVSQGLAHERHGPPVASFVLYNADCRPVAGGAIRDARTALVIDDRGVAIDGMDVGVVDLLMEGQPDVLYREIGDCRGMFGG